MPRPTKRLTALELFSGIGAFSAGIAGRPVEVRAAFDQNDAANLTYRANFGLVPTARNLDAVSARDLPEADLWWMSPPCTPYSVRGHRRDDEDPRAASFLNLIARLEKARPGALMVENVAGFVGSKVHARLLEALKTCGYGVAEVDLCPTQFGVPMRRPRHYVIGARGRALALPATPAEPRRPLSDFLETEPAAELTVPREVVGRYGRSFNVVEPGDPEATAICVTSGYYRSVRAAGSYVRLPDGGVRRLSPGEVLGLLGFPATFGFPADVPEAARYRLVGNSVDVRAVRWLVDALLAM
jgi:DNA (cytosine-5)-methyltransferase 1